MSASTLDPVIHNPERMRITATLAALPDGDAMSVNRLQDMLGLTTGHLVARLGELCQAGYVRARPACDGGAPAAVALTTGGRTALKRYAATVRDPSALVRPPQSRAPGLRVSDADRAAAAAALGEHFAQGRLTLNELHARLDAALTATTCGELSQATWDCPAAGSQERKIQ